MTKQNNQERKEELLDIALELSLQTNRRVWWPFIGRSMLPHISEGDMLLVQHGLYNTKLGDILVFRDGKAIVAHRVVSIRRYDGRTVFIMKGDNRRVFDPPVPGSSVIGRVVGIRRDKRLIDLMESRNKFLSFAVSRFSYVMGCLHRITRFVHR